MILVSTLIQQEVAMSTMINREVKRGKLVRDCQHDFTADTIRDPADKRVVLRSRTVIWADDKAYLLKHCVLCGMGKLHDDAS